MKYLNASILGILTILAGTGPAFAQRAGIDTLVLESHARFLAHDLLEGRHPASRGERLAALYIVTRLTALGLQPLPGADYRMPVPLTAVDIDQSTALLRIASDSETREVRPPAFYHPGGARPAFRDFAGELLFVGAAADALAALEDHDDLSGYVVVLTPPWSGLTEVETALLERGAEGSIQLIPNGRFYDRLRVVRGPTRYYLPDAVNDPANQSRLPRVTGGPDLMAALGLDDGASSDTPSGARPLGATVEVELPYTTRARTGYNLAAYAPGADPALRNEMVVYIAHYDHVGYGEPTAGDSLWNGFIDNAAGSAILLEIARAMAADPPARSVAFLWVTAEEQGLLGANWFVHDPPIPLERIHAALNIDGGAPPAPPTRWGVVGADFSHAGRTARRVVENHGWTVTTAAIGPQSDHWPFAQAAVPTTMLFPGPTLEGLSEQEARDLAERWLHPHTPDDEWSPEFPFSGLQRYAELAFAIGRALAEK